MPIKTVEFKGRFHPYMKNDCVVLRIWDKKAQHIEMSFPFHEDTPNFNLTIAEAMNLRDAIDELIDIKLIEKPRRKSK